MSERRVCMVVVRRRCGVVPGALRSVLGVFDVTSMSTGLFHRAS